VSQVQRAANGAKDSDTKRMKTDILDLIPEKYLPETGGEGIVRKVAASYIESQSPGTSKVWRGFNNAITARLLCPAKYIEQFKGDPDGYAWRLNHCIHILTTEHRTRRELKHRRLRLIDREGSPFFPIFLYDEEMMDGTTTKGLFRGPLLVKAGFAPPLKAIADRFSQAYRSIFLGPSESYKVGTKRGKKRGNAAIHGMRAVKPSTICYVVVQVTPYVMMHTP